MLLTYTLARAQVAKVGACVEIALQDEDGMQLIFAAMPEQADELSEDIEKIPDELKRPSGPLRPTH